MTTLERASELLSRYTDAEILTSTVRTTADEREIIERHGKVITQLVISGATYWDAAHAVTLVLRERRKAK